MNEPKILVTGAPGGTQGSTAGKLVRLLREAHVPVRAFFHHTGPRSEALAQLGAEIHIGDMLDIVSEGGVFLKTSSGNLQSES